tara:strand:+ start:168 stop:344 length:177 start_codon:yes stop_codon:yes gene_type:complete
MEKKEINILLIIMIQKEGSILIKVKKLPFIFCLDTKEAKNQDNPYEIAAHHSLLIFHA